MVYYILGVISTLAVGIFVWTLRRGKGNSPGTLKQRVDTNNLDTGRGLEKLKDNNEEAGRIIDEAQDIAGAGLKTIDDTNRTVSEIIAAAKRDSKKKPKG